MTYRFGPLERRGLLGGIRLGQAIAVAGGLLTALLAIGHAPTPGGAAIALVACLAAAVSAFAPLAGRTPVEWLPVAMGFLGRRATGGHAFRSRVATAGTIIGRTTTHPRHPRPRPRPRPGRRWRRASPTALDTPAAIGDVRIVQTDSSRPIGVLSERAGTRLTAVLACRVGAFALLDRDAQERRLARWGIVLSSAGGTAIRRIQWIERTAPAQGDELARWVHSERDPAIPLRGTAMIESYLELISSSTRVSQEHEVLVAVQVDRRRVRDRGDDAVMQALLEQTTRIAHGLTAGEVTVLGALSAGQLGRALRTAFDPYARAELAALEAADRERDGVSGTAVGPLGAQESWDHYQSDGALHATYWIGAWPRVDVTPMFMDALLGQSNAVRTVAVTFEPIAPDRSTREVEAAVTRDRADRELRGRFGQSETARQRQAVDATQRRESELAAGHGEVRLTGFVTVSGRDADDLRRSCAEVSDHAARARLELHRLYGQQADAFTFTLPLCRGLR